MWRNWTKHPVVWAPADEGSGGPGGEGQGSDGGDGEAGEGDGGEAGEGNASTSSILDFANKTQADAQDGDAWKMPEGLELPPHLVGLSSDDTLAKVAKAYQGARRELSTKGKGEGKLEGAVPDTPDGYTFEAEGDDDKIAAELNDEASKPVVDAFRQAAHKLGIPDKAFSQFMREGLANVAEQGIPIGATDEEAYQLSGEAEMATLTEEVGAVEAGTIVNTISTYGEKLVSRGVLKDEGDISEFAQMVGTAKAARIFHRILTGEMGEKPIPQADGADGSVTPQEAYARHAAASRLPQGAERDQALQDANNLMQKAFGNNSTGSVRSSVL